MLKGGKLVQHSVSAADGLCETLHTFAPLQYEIYKVCQMYIYAYR